jgi:5-methylcytosine-specific restriction enzyme A
MAKLQTLKSRLQTVGSRLPTVNPNSWRSDKNSTQRGYNYKWQQAREGYLAKHPLCAYCEREGRVTAATVVDHIEPHRGDMTLFWDSSNWQSLCKTCHDSVKKREESNV